jgi:antitoxin (DNA-binding transcriptional repressor) of toxin-antitoxin stability system
LRQNLSRYLDRVKAGESLDVTERGQVVARLSPAGDLVSPEYRRLAEEFGASVPTGSFADVVAAPPGQGAPAGTTDALLAEGRAERRFDS